MQSLLSLVAWTIVVSVSVALPEPAEADPEGPAKAATSDEGTDPAAAETEEEKAMEERARAFARRNGYKPVQNGDRWVYCRRESTTASRVGARERCYTQETLLQSEEAARHILDEGTRRMPQPRESG